MMRKEARKSPSIITGSCSLPLLSTMLGLGGNHIIEWGIGSYDIAIEFGNNAVMSRHTQSAFDIISIKSYILSAEKDS
jgi:hypothetical protein